MDRHPPMPPERLARFIDGLLAPFDRREAWLNTVAIAIAEEARATKCEHIRFQDALLVLTFERWERGILSKDERDSLVSRLFS